jgi:GNAT superfamily N-acetyltransferase
MTRPGRLITLIVLLAIAAAALERTSHAQDPAMPRRAPVAAPRTTPRPRPHAAITPATAAQVDSQDQLDRRQRRDEAAELRGHRLLDHLPLELAGVRIAVARISPDGQRTLLVVHPGPHGRGFAHALYRQALRTYGDPGRHYELRWER